ncbi:MAG: MBL fold metallo-hydrolase [Candidatus Peribacteria bacterium]|nr:MAG: MBL fold metallo-hydrolase [Candidatus Peribacteria bacterium]
MQDFLDELDNELDGGESVSEADFVEQKQPKPAVSEQRKPTPPVKNQPRQKTFSKNKPDSKNRPETFVPQKNFGTFVSRFPDVKFYLPTLRDKYTRFIPIGGNNETGAKNMGMFQYGDDIMLVDCGVQFADMDMLGANYSVPDVSFLTKYTKNIKGFVITHAHLDHIGALKHILPALDMPVLYGTRLTLGIIRK